MSEVAAACYNAGPFYSVPSIVASAGVSLGQAVAFPGSLVDDFIFLWSSSPDLTIPGTPSGYTALGAGLSHDASGNDTSACAYVKRVTANGEGAPANGSSRGGAVCVRGMATNFASGLSPADYQYQNSGGNTFRIPPVTLVRPTPVLVFTKRMGTAASPVPDMTELWVTDAENAEARACWTAGNVDAFLGYDYAASIVSAQARVVCSIRLRGKQL